MTPSEIAFLYDGFSKDKQMDFLARLAHDITITMRGCYSSTPQLVNSNAGSVVGRLNEIQHRIIGFLRDLIIEDTYRATGQEIVDNILGWAKPAHFDAQMLRTLDVVAAKVTGR